MKFALAEAKALPFPDASFDLVTIAFAARNLNIDKEKLLAALREFRRVLRPGGLFLNLETTRLKNPALWFLMKLYVRAVIGLLNLLSPKSSSSYNFLKETILGFYDADEFSALLAEAGFTAASHRTLFPAAAALHTARKRTTARQPQPVPHHFEDNERFPLPLFQRTSQESYRLAAVRDKLL